MFKPYRLGALLGAVILTSGCAVNATRALADRHSSVALAPQDGVLTHAFVAPADSGGRSGYHMISVGLDGLAARLELIGTAQHCLDVQYYIFRNDESGSLIAQALLKAADRGVRIRILMDDGEDVDGDERLFSLAAHPQVEMRVYNPFDYRGHVRLFRALDFTLHKSRLDHRMHDKLLVADSAVAVIGGRNLGDQYFQIDSASQFGDDDVVVAGPMVAKLSQVFDEFWNNPFSTPAQAFEPKALIAGPALEAYRHELANRHRQDIFESELVKRLASGEPLASLTSGKTPLSWAEAKLVYDSPDKMSVYAGDSQGSLIYEPIDERTASATSDLMMITPYLVPSPKEMQLIKAARRRGVSVRILTNSLVAAPAVTPHAGYTHYRRALLEEGVEMHEIRALVAGTKGIGQSRRMSKHGNYALHAKLYVFDSKSLFVGSMNFDQRSRRLNTEIGLIIESPELAREAARRFNSLTELQNSYWVSLSTPVRGAPSHLIWKTAQGADINELTEEPARDFWQRLRLRVASLLPIDDEL